MISNKKNKKTEKDQLLLRLSKPLILHLRQSARKENLSLSKFCEKFLDLSIFFSLDSNLGVITDISNHKIIKIQENFFNRLIKSRAGLYREGKHLGISLYPFYKSYSVEDTLKILNQFGWGRFDFYTEKKQIVNINPIISSADFIKGILEGIMEIDLKIISTDTSVFLYKIIV